MKRAYDEISLAGETDHSTVSNPCGGDNAGMAGSQACLASLPTQLVRMIMDHLAFEDIFSLGLVNQRFRAMTTMERDYHIMKLEVRQPRSMHNETPYLPAKWVVNNLTCCRKDPNLGLVDWHDDLESLKTFDDGLDDSESRCQISFLDHFKAIKKMVLSSLKHLNHLKVWKTDSISADEWQKEWSSLRSLEISSWQSRMEKFPQGLIELTLPSLSSEEISTLDLPLFLRKLHVKAGGSESRVEIRQMPLPSGLEELTLEALAVKCELDHLLHLKRLAIFADSSSNVVLSLPTSIKRQLEYLGISQLPDCRFFTSFAQLTELELKVEVLQELHLPAGVLPSTLQILKIERYDITCLELCDLPRLESLSILHGTFKTPEAIKLPSNLLKVQLKYLQLRSLLINGHTFLPDSVKHLDISRNEFKVLRAEDLPEQLTRLVADACQLTLFDLSACRYLKFISARGNMLEKFTSSQVPLSASCILLEKNILREVKIVDARPNLVTLAVGSRFRLSSIDLSGAIHLTRLVLNPGFFEKSALILPSSLLSFTLTPTFEDKYTTRSIIDAVNALPLLRYLKANQDAFSFSDALNLPSSLLCFIPTNQHYPELRFSTQRGRSQ